MDSVFALQIVIALILVFALGGMLTGKPSGTRQRKIWALRVLVLFLAVVFVILNIIR